MEPEAVSFSIIIPTYNRPEQITACLKSLSRLDYPRGRFEVIVIDDGGNRSLQPIVSSFSEGLDVTLIKQINAGPAAARNIGAKKAKGDFLVFIDDDCAPCPNWLHNLSARCFRTPDQGIGGKTLNGLPHNLFSSASQAILDVVYAYYNTGPKQPLFFASNNLALPADLFHAIGGFDDTFATSEDRDICDRWKQQGFRLTYAPEVLLYHSHALNICTFWRQHFNYGRGACRYYQARARRGAEGLRLDPRFYVRLFCYPFALRRRLETLSMIALLVVSQAATAFGYSIERLNYVRGR
jgi:glycosyltransferase involved in cell wall biosynthesis